MKAIITFWMLLIGTGLIAQPVAIASLEEFTIPRDTFLNGRAANGKFESGNAVFPNDYSAQFDSWSGWAISSKKDTVTSGYLNQYSAKTGVGVNGSNNYAVSYGSENVIRFDSRVTLGGFYITNSTYAYNSMRQGDQFSKRFGGETGNDPDFFSVAIYKYLNGALSKDSVHFYLADYRFVNNSQDYIIKDWIFVNLASLGEADSLFFRVASSDVGEFGINTPVYFCLDNLITTPLTTDVNDLVNQLNFKIFPNPTSDALQLKWQGSENGLAQLLDVNGKIIETQIISNGAANMQLQFLPKGVYLLKIIINGQYFTQKIIKQ